MTNSVCGKVRITTVTLLFIIILTATVPLGEALGWSADEQLTTDPGYDMMPSIMQTRDGTIWIVWTSDRIELGKYDLYYKTSSDNGLSWSNPTRISWHPSIDERPAIMQTRDKKIWLVWACARTGNKEIIYKTSSNNGFTWSTVSQLTSNTVTDSSPSITQNIDGTICVVWHRNATGEDSWNYDIFCKTSSDYGLTWSNETRVTTDPSLDMKPSVTHLENGTLLVVFTSHRADDNFEIFWKSSHDNGMSWSDATRITTDTANLDASPSIVQDMNGTIWVVWSKELEIYYKTSNNYGASWSPDTYLTKSAGDDTNPSVMNSEDSRMWVVWESTRSDFDIYYKISDEIPSVHDIAVIDMVTFAASGAPLMWVPRGVPIYVNVTVENQGHFLETFDVTAYAEKTVGDGGIHIETQHDVSLTAGANTTLTLTWNTIDAEYGTYYISSNATVVPGEYDITDNILMNGAKIGGICVPWQPSQTNLFSLLARLASTIFLIVVLGAIAITFFKTLMSVRLQRPWRQSLGHHMKNTQKKRGFSFISKATKSDRAFMPQSRGTRNPPYMNNISPSVSTSW